MRNPSVRGRAATPPAPAPRAAVVHVLTAAARPALEGVGALLHAGGRPAIVVLPAGAGWAGVAGACRDAGARVARTVPAPCRGLAALGHAARMAGPLRACFARWGTALVHAHDDAAALLCAPAARVAGVPLVWDVDLDVAPAWLDRVRLGAAAYLVLRGSGGRLAAARRLPPHHHRPPSPHDDRRALAAAYEQLTGLPPAPPAGPAAPDALVRLDTPAGRDAAGAVR